MPKLQDESKKAKLPRCAHRERGHDGAPAPVVDSHLGVEPPPAQGDGLGLVLEQVRPHSKVVVEDVLPPVQVVQPEVELIPICRQNQLIKQGILKIQLFYYCFFLP